MSALKIDSNPKVKLKFETYPKQVRAKLNVLRKLILETAQEIDSIEELAMFNRVEQY